MIANEFDLHFVIVKNMRIRAIFNDLLKFIQCVILDGLYL